MWRRFCVCLAMLAMWSFSYAQSNDNYPDRKAIIINNSPNVELSGFSFRNSYADRRTRFEQDMRWKNIGQQPIAAFEIVILKYDAFDQRMIGTRWVVTGRDSANWSHLAPGESAGDGTRGFGSEEVMTAVAYVRAVRLADGTVWRANEAELLQNLRQVAPGIKEYGSVRPDAKPTAEQK
jgi:hypothetical protein